MELHTLLTTPEIQFDIIGISESSLKHNKHYTTNTDIPNYNIEHCDGEGANGGMFLYIKKDIAYKLRNDLKMYESKHLESTFIEIINQQKSIILGCVYRHPCMEINEFNNDYFSYLSENLLGEKSKNVILMEDFNVDLLKYKNGSNTADFLDLVYSSSLVPQITTPTRLSPRSKTLIDNIFTTDNTENILTTIFDHLAQFILHPIKQLKRDNKMDMDKFQTISLSERFLKY